MEASYEGGQSPEGTVAQIYGMELQIARSRITYLKYCKIKINVIIITIIFSNCNWVVTRSQWLFYMYTEYEIGYY